MRLRFHQLLLVSLAIGCSQGAGAVTAATLPPYVGAYQPQGVDEIGLWREEDEQERLLAASDIVIRDPELNEYVKRVLCDTVGNDRCNATRIYILRIPAFNATMAPNGTMRIFSGLLLRVRNEAELGAVLGHEFGHFEQRHSLAGFKNRRTGTDVIEWASVLAGFSNNQLTWNSFQDVKLAVLGAMYRFDREQERAADRLGIAYLNNSRFRPQAAAEIWASAIREAAASASVKGLKKPNFNQIAFTASHPPHGERAGYLAELALPDAAGRDDGAESYRAALATWLPLFLDDQVKLNDFGATDYIINSIASEHGWTAALLRARGDLYRTRGYPRDLIAAAEFYGQAVGLDPGQAEAHRGLGLVRLKLGHDIEGGQSLKTYLTLKPEAADAKLIAMLIPSMETTP